MIFSEIFHEKNSWKIRGGNHVEKTQFFAMCWVSLGGWSVAVDTGWQKQLCFWGGQFFLRKSCGWRYFSHDDLSCQGIHVSIVGCAPLMACFFWRRKIAKRTDELGLILLTSICANKLKGNEQQGPKTHKLWNRKKNWNATNHKLPLPNTKH